MHTLSLSLRLPPLSTGTLVTDSPCSRRASLNLLYRIRKLPAPLSRVRPGCAFPNSIPKTLIQIAVILVSLAAAPAIQAQSCPNIPSGGSESISATITIDGTSTVLTEQAFVAVGTRVRIDSVAQADGTCTGMALYCDGGCACDETGYVYDRTINHTNVRVDASTTGGPNGNYAVGSVYGRNPNGTTAFWNELNTEASNSTGPN